LITTFSRVYPKKGEHAPGKLKNLKFHAKSTSFFFKVSCSQLREKKTRRVRRFLDLFGRASLFSGQHGQQSENTRIPISGRPVLINRRFNLGLARKKEGTGVKKKEQRRVLFLRYFAVNNERPLRIDRDTQRMRCKGALQLLIHRDS